MTIQDALARIAEHGHLDQQEMQEVMQDIMTGNCTPAQIGAFLLGLRMKGESLEEITGAAKVMRELAEPMGLSGPHLIDTSGTGGDGQHLFNVSTAVAFVVAAAGGQVAKHGNRGVSSSSGSADLLEAAGARIDLSPDQVAKAVRVLGIGFMFAPNFHLAMRHAVGPRKELGMRTLFNMLGPLTNPAGVKRQLIGVFSEKLCEPLARVLGRLGSEHVLVVHSRDGLDEISLASTTTVAEYQAGEVHRWQLTPEAVGLKTQTLAGLEVSSAAESLALVKQALEGGSLQEVAAKARDMIALNAGAALYVAGLAPSIVDGVSQAMAILQSGQAWQRLQDYAIYTQKVMAEAANAS